MAATMMATVKVILSRLYGDPHSGFVYGKITVSHGPTTVTLDYPKNAPAQIAVGSAFFLTGLTVPSETTLTIRADLHNPAWTAASDAIVNASKDFPTPLIPTVEDFSMHGTLGDIKGTVTWTFV